MPPLPRPNHRDIVLLAIAAWFLLAFCLRAWAQPLDDLTAGTLLLQTENDAEPVPALRLDTDVSIRVSGMIASVELQQRFSNTSAQFAEGLYAFPLPDDAAVNSMVMLIGDRRIEGEIREKAEAARVYHSARASGQRASLLDQNRPNLFTSRVANLAPGETVVVEISYVQPLRYRSGQFRLRFPMAVTPRYENSASVPGEAVSEARSEVNPTRIQVQLVPGFALTQLNSLYHDVTVAHSNDRYSVALTDQVVASDRDFELVWEPALGDQPQAALFTESGTDGQYALLMVVPPKFEAVHDRPRELIMVIDTSGSMFGESLDQARQSVVMALATLGEQDRFNLIDFDSDARALFHQPQPASASRIGEAIEYVEGLTADGGTEIGAALELALGMKADPDSLRQVVFVTDGSVANEVELFTLIEARLGSSRLFTVGIGAAPNAYFMRKAAQFGRGSYTFIGDAAMVSSRMDELLQRLERPALTDLCIDWPGFAESYPSRLPDLYAGEPMMLTARLDVMSGKADVCGQTPLDSWNVTLDLKADMPAAGVGTLWARRKIDQLMDDLALGAPPADIRPQVVETALAHRLVSRYTSFVAVDKTPVRPPGWSLQTDAMAATAGDGLSMRLPGTATDAPARITFGVALLILGLIVARRLRYDA